jgi:hypothetical protein
MFTLPDVPFVVVPEDRVIKPDAPEVDPPAPEYMSIGPPAEVEAPWPAVKLKVLPVVPLPVVPFKPVIVTAPVREISIVSTPLVCNRNGFAVEAAKVPTVCRY